MPDAPPAAHTSVTLLGTGVPHPSPGRAGAATLVRHGDVSLLFDAGRAAVLRLTEAGVRPFALTGVFVTHVHSDHLVDLADLAITRWVEQQLHRTGPLAVHAVEGVAARFVERMLEPYDVDIAVRRQHTGAGEPGVDLRAFEAPAPGAPPITVWSSPDRTVRVEAIAVHHEPVPEAVAYRVTTPDGAVVVSGDTRVCAEVEAFAAGADVLVHEACRATAMSDLTRGTVFEHIFEYHADTVALGGLAQRAGVRHLVLTHLIPAPATEADEATFADDVRSGGYEGRLTVGRDLFTTTLVAPG
ncbi:MAG: MBL fold metallo-hydrolase [Acidimicrobiales bacterium]